MGEWEPHRALQQAGLALAHPGCLGDSACSQLPSAVCSEGLFLLFLFLAPPTPCTWVGGLRESQWRVLLSSLYVFGYWFFV